jgi:hypothetical protein
MSSESVIRSSPSSKLQPPAFRQDQVDYVRPANGLPSNP